MKNAVITTKKAASERKLALLKKINYDPVKAAKAWKDIAGVWENRNDIDPTTMNTQDYLIIIEPTKTGFSAYSPDLNGCITVGETVEEARENMKEAIGLYLEELMESGENIPAPKKLTEQINAIGNVQKGAFIAFIPNQAQGFHAKSA